MSTTLPLFWHLSASSKKERIDASVKLVGALEKFQAEFVSAKQTSNGLGRSDEDSDEDDDEEIQGQGEQERKKRQDDLDVLNAQDVSYSIRRLVRGLASPRESSRLGFAVALTELLSRLNTVTCAQVLTLILDSSKTQGSMTGQEERDMLFARLFGITSIVQSGLITRTTSLSTSSPVSTLSSFSQVIEELFALGEKRSWLRESAWWTISLALDALIQNGPNIEWREEAIEETVNKIYVENKSWTPEKVALTVKLQHSLPQRNWRACLNPPFKQADILDSGNYATLARILKVYSSEIYR